jgi:hypothetical protein
VRRRRTSESLCKSSIEDEGMTLRSRLSGAGSKPLQAAAIKSGGRER